MNNIDQILTKILVSTYLPDTSDNLRDQTLSSLADLLEKRLEAEPPSHRGQLRKQIRAIRDDLTPRAPPEVNTWLAAAVLSPALLSWAKSVLQPDAGELSSGDFEQRVTGWFEGLPAAEQSSVLGAAIRHEIGQAINSDEQLRTVLSGALRATKESSMAVFNFAFDTRGLPDSLRTPALQAAWESAVNDQIANLGLPADNTNAVTDATYGVIKGMLLLDEQFDTGNAEFPAAVQRVWIETLGTTRDSQGKIVRNRDLYAVIARSMASSSPLLTAAGTSAPPKLILQQFASVSRYVVSNAVDVPSDSPLFNSQIRLGMDRYVGGPPPAETLDIPPLTGPSGPEGELEPANMFCFSTMYAVKQLDDMMLWDTVDSLTEDWLNGLFATGFDSAGKLLDTWFWGRRDRMTAPERRMIYSRMLGVGGGDIPKDVQPNTDFNDRFMGFLGSIAEFDRQNRISDLFNTSLAGNRGRSLAMTMENVRQKGHDLAANMSLYGYGYSHFAARRLNADLTAAFNLLKNPEVQRLLGVTNPYQVIERTATARQGKAPDIVRLRTMADAGKRILDIVARNAGAWTSASGLPLFPDLTGSNSVSNDAAISMADTLELIRQTQFWLAVNGIQDQQVDNYSKPVVAPYAPSIPSMNGMNGSMPAMNGGGAGSAMDKIKQMVASGQAPTLDQLKSVLPTGLPN